MLQNVNFILHSTVPTPCIQYHSPYPSLLEDVHHAIAGIIPRILSRGEHTNTYVNSGLYYNYCLYMVLLQSRDVIANLHYVQHGISAPILCFRITLHVQYYSKYKGMIMNRILALHIYVCRNFRFLLIAKWTISADWLCSKHCY